MFDALLFDFDGVLADTEPVHFACWRRVLAEFEIDLAWPYYERECIGISDRLMIERLGAAKHPPVSIDQLWPSYARKQELFRARIAAEPPFDAAIHEFLREMNRSYKLAVVSSSHRSEVEPPLERAGLRPLFQAMVCGMEVPKLKPAPDPYLRAAELLGAQSPLVIEDSDPGVASGHAAGFEVLRLSSASALRQELLDFLQRQPSAAGR